MDPKNLAKWHIPQPFCYSFAKEAFNSLQLHNMPGKNPQNGFYAQFGLNSPKQSHAVHLQQPILWDFHPIKMRRPFGRAPPNLVPTHRGLIPRIPDFWGAHVNANAALPLNFRLLPVACWRQPIFSWLSCFSMGFLPSTCYLHPSLEHLKRHRCVQRQFQQVGHQQAPTFLRAGCIVCRLIKLSPCICQHFISHSTGT